jgi:hypothetical protein
MGARARCCEIAERLTIGNAAPRAVLQDVAWTLPGSLEDLHEAYRIDRYRNAALFLLALANKNTCPLDCTPLAAACSFSYSSVFSFSFRLLSFATTLSLKGW